MSTDLGNLGLVTRFAGGVSRGVCYQVNGWILCEGTPSYTQFNSDQARAVAELILCDLIDRGKFDPHHDDTLSAKILKAYRRVRS